MNDFVVPALVKRRAETAGELEKAQARVRELYADLGALDAVIRQLQPDYPLHAIRAKTRRAPDGAGLGTVARSVLDALRRAGRPMGAPEMAALILAERGPPGGGDATARRTMLSLVCRALRHQRSLGTVRNTGKAGRSALWVLADPS